MMKKRKLLAALLLCTAVSLNASGIAATHDVNVTEVINKTYDGYTFNGDGGGAIYNNTAISSVINNSIFKNNQAIGNDIGQGGAIRSTLGANVDVKSSTFTNNSADWYGAIAHGVSGGMMNINDSTFTNNEAGAGGAIGNFAGKNTNSGMTITNSSFISNKATLSDDEGGGALYLGSESKTNIQNTIFKDNTSAAAGGAIATRIGNGVNNNSGATLDVTGSTFENNTAGTNGGAIYNSFYNSASNSGSVNFSSNKFINNTAGESGGAIYTEKTADKNGFSAAILVDNSSFSGNNAKNGGAIAHSSNGAMQLKNLTFENNKASKDGGALFIDNTSNTTIDNVAFNNNTAYQGGAIRSTLGANVDVKSSTFTNNSADWYGAIAHGVSGGMMNINDSTFTNNEAGAGGAIGNFAGKNTNSGMTITNSSFISNKATLSDDEGGGALYLGSESKTNIQNSVFKGNDSKTVGGAIATRIGNGVNNNSGATLDVTGSTFENNTARTNGGAIYNSFYNSASNNGSVNISSNNFINNTAGSSGGAIYTEKTADKNGGSANMTIDNSNFKGNSAQIGGAIAHTSEGLIDVKNSTFEGNTASIQGGAIATYIDATIADSSFTNNSAGSNGGAVWANQNLTVNAENSNIVMSGNTAANGGDIYMNTAGTNLNMNAADGKSITVASGISGNTYNMNVNSNGGTGSLVINSAIQNATIDVQNGTFHLAQGSALNNSTLNMASGSTLNTANNQISSFDNNITLQDNVNLVVDVDLGNNKADNFSNANVQGNVTITDVNPIANTTSNNVSVNLVEALGIDPNSVTISSALQSETQTVLTPIRYLSGSVSETGLLTMAPTGNGYKDFNPSVMASPIAAQLGGYLTQLNSYDQAFRNMDMYMLMTKKQREALKLRNKYAAADGNLIFDPTGNQYDDRAAWVRPYATFENVPLKGGPRVSNVAYGSFFGVDSEMYDLGNGWDGMLSFYAGYNGSHQAYDGIGIYQNGGTLGVVGMAYKGNFFTGLTINAGANAGEASTYYGTDNFAMLMAGIASKTGYNFELADGKFIIQPSLQLSYSFVNTFDYTNAAGARISSDPLNAIQVEPGIKFIGNLKNGWQPYAGVSVVWNIMDKTNFHANNVSLPDLSVKPYVRYGLGVRKTWGERCVGFFQTYFTSGGRNGVGLQTGFRYTLGKGGNGSVSNKTPERPKAQLQLSNCDVSPKF